MLAMARKNGAKLIVVDLRRTKEAETADFWLQIRPGSDLVLLMGWICYIIANDLYDRKFVSEWTVGFEELKQAAEAYTPEYVEEWTDRYPGAHHDGSGKNVRDVPPRRDPVRSLLRKAVRMLF